MYPSSSFVKCEKPTLAHTAGLTENSIKSDHRSHSALYLLRLESCTSGTLDRRYYTVYRYNLTEN